MRCPFRMKGFDQPDTCDPECAWRMTYEPAPGGLGISPISSCAVAILAQEANCSYGVRFEGEDNDEVGANDVIAAGEFDALDEHAQALERENAELRKLCGANDTLAAENDVSAKSVDTNDSHAKLEEDWTEFYTTHERECLYQSDVGQFVFDLLDRQAAITERDLCRQCSWPSLAAMPDKEAYDRIAELQAKLDQMTVDRDILQDCVDDLNADASELQRQVDELTAERDKLRDKVRHQSRQLTDTQNALENRNEETKPRWKRDTKKLQNKIDELTAELTAARNAHAQAEHEAVILREKLGRALDYAHEITSVGGDC